MDKKLTFSNPDEICRYLKERIVVRENREPTEKTDGDWSDADFIAIIRLKSVFHKASANFSGTAYVAEIVEMEQGRNEDIVWFQEQSMLITLDDRKTQVGGTYRVGFSLKNGATMVYTQEGTETITLMDE